MITQAQREIWIGAIARRDKASRGHFVYGVRTTKTSCAPGCPARMPKLENIVLFETLDEAVETGFRACKRYRPET